MEFEDIQERPFDVVDQKYVICVDLLGQDRQLDDDEKRFVLQTVKNYIEVWERTEVASLTRDRDRKLK